MGFLPPGFVEQPVIPATFLVETVGAIRREAAGQARLMKDQYSSIARGYTEMSQQFDLNVRQTDRILADRDARFEQILRDIRKDILQYHQHQTAVVTSLEARLVALEGRAETSRDARTLGIEDVAKSMLHGFDRLAALINQKVPGELYSYTFQPFPI